MTVWMTDVTALSSKIILINYTVITVWFVCWDRCMPSRNIKQTLTLQHQPNVLPCHWCRLVCEWWGGGGGLSATQFFPCSLWSLVTENLVIRVIIELKSPSALWCDFKSIWGLRSGDAIVSENMYSFRRRRDSHQSGCVTNSEGINSVAGTFPKKPPKF